MNRRRAAAALLALAALAFTLLSARAASAHATLLGTDPADGAALDEPPSTITLNFNEPVEPVAESMRLVDSTGRDHPVEAASRDDDVVVEIGPGLGDGDYALNWRVISADDHPISGVLGFSVGTGTAPPPSESADVEDGRAAVMTVNAAHYLGLLVFGGLVFFRIAIARGQGPSNPRHRTLRATAATAVAASAAAVPIGALAAAGLPLDRIVEPDSWTGSVQTEALVILGLTALGLGASYRWYTRGGHRWTAAGSLVAVGVATAAPVLIGHSRLFEPDWLMLGADIAHLLTGAVWTGGLLGLLLLLRQRRAQDDAVGTATVVARFSTWAGLTVALLAASGTTMALLMHRTWDGLFGSDHGRLLLVKLAVVAAALALAGWNRFRLVPTVRGAADPRSGLSRLRRLLSAEAVVVGLAIVLTGSLVQLSPDTTGAEQAPIALEAEIGDGEVTAVLTPGETGANTLTFDLRDTEGRALEPTEAPMIHAFLPEQDFGPVHALAAPDPDGGYRAELDLPLSGTWELEIHVRISRFEEHQATLTAEVH